MEDSVVAISPKKNIAKHVIRKDATERKMSPSSTKKPFKRSEERPDDAERMKDRIKAVALNKEIAQHASRKQLSEAMVLFEKAASLGWANSHTYGAAINANIRCGNVSGAAGLFQKLRSTKGLKIDVITCTTMLKGFCSEGDIARSVQLFDEMEKSRPPVVPNIRTINTFLRGCVITGDVENADKMISKTQKDYVLTPDVSTWEYLVTLLCQGLLLDKAAPIVGRLQSDVTMAPDLGGMNVVLAKAASLTGAWKVCRRAIENARASIDLNETQDHIDATAALQGLNDGDKDHEDKNIEEDDISKKEATGGKRAWKTSAADEDPGSDTRAQSLEIFRKHKREELRQELVIVSAFMDKMILANEVKNKERARAKELIIKAERLSKKKAEQEVKGESIDGTSNVTESKEVEIVNKKRKGGSETVENVVEDSKLLYLLPFYSRLFSFVMPPKHQNNIIIVNTDLPENSITGTVTTDSKRIAVDELSKALFAKFGLNVCLEKLNLGYEVPIEDPEVALKKLKENEKKKTPKPDNRRDKNLERKLKKKGLSNNNDTKPKEGSGNELKFKELFSLNVLPDGFINFAEVFTEKAFAPSTMVSSDEKIVEAKSDSNVKSEKKCLEGSKKAIETTSTRPLKMEICSGAGEWAVSQANADQHSDWVTLELRHDRVYQTFTRAIYAGAENVCVIGGDATQVLPQRIPSSSMDFLFINHPEPPQQTGGLDSQGKHLLTMDFFGELSRILKPSGMITIVTDNIWYGKFLIRLLASQGSVEFLSSVSPKNLLAKMMKGNKGNASLSLSSDSKKAKDAIKIKKKDGKNKKSSSSSEIKVESEDKDKDTGVALTGATGEWALLEREGTINLYSGKPGSECGVMVDASSYFDRLWKSDQKIERYFLVLERGTAPYSSKIHGNGIKPVTEKSKVKQELRISNTTNLAERAKKGGYAEKALKAAAFHQAGGSNKKIKFND